MEDKHSVIISMAEYEKFMEYEKFINKLKQEHKKMVEYTVVKIIESVENFSDEFLKYLEGYPRYLMQDKIFVLENYKKFLIEFKEVGSKQIMDSFIQETIDNTINKDNHE